MDKKGCDRKMAVKTGIDTTRREDLSVRAALSLADTLYDYTITRLHIARKRQTRTLDICHEDYELRYPRYPEDQRWSHDVRLHTERAEIPLGIHRKDTIEKEVFDFNPIHCTVDWKAQVPISCG
jgi:hypothetical protein